MKKHVKIYIDFFGYGEQDFIPCEISGQRAVDIHHIDNKGMGGSNCKDTIENLMALAREYHEAAHAEKYKKETLYKIHKAFMLNHKNNVK